MIRRLNNLKNMKKTYLLLLFVVLFLKGFSQEQDMTLSLDQFLEIVKLNHQTKFKTTTVGQIYIL